MDNLLAYYEAPPAGCFREEVKNMADFTVTYTLALPVGLQINFNFSTLEYFEYFRKNFFLTYGILKMIKDNLTICSCAN